MIRQTEIKAIVNREWGDMNRVFLVKHEGDKTYNGVVKKGVIEWQEVKEGAIETPTPFVQLPQWIWQEIVNALTETTPPVKKERVEAELDATKRHLADMRRLVFDAPRQEHEEPEDETFSKN